MKQKAIVMGASSGIGREVALRLLRDGWQVAVAARREDALRTIEVAGKPRPIVARIDVQAEDADQQLHALIAQLGGVDLYFHAAGIGWQNMELEATKELATAATNCGGFTRLIGEAYRWMATHNGGHIAAITSVAATRGLGPAPAYSASKAYQAAYLQALEQQAHARQLPICFTDLRPGFVDTPLLSGAHFPMMLRVKEVADEIMWAIDNHRHVRIIDGRWRWVVRLWRMVPAWIWRRMKLIR